MSSNPRGWWEWAWSSAELLSESPTSTAAESALSLPRDWATQAYLFVEKQLGSAEWLPFLEAAHLFDAPPPVIRSTDGIAARSWPALVYLRRVAPDRPQDVSRILLDLETDNWWAISDGMELAAQLRGPQGVQALLHLVELWDRAEIKWRSPDTWGATIGRLANSARGRRVLPAVVALLATSLLETAHAGYESAIVLPAILDAVPPPDLGLVANGLESAIASHEALVPRKQSLHGSIWSVRESDWSERDSLIRIVRTWLDAVEQEAADVGNPALAARASVLLTSRSSTLNRMGIRALDLSLQQTQGTLGVSLLMYVLRDPDFDAYPVGGEVARLVGSVYSRLPRDAQASILTLVRDRAGQEADSDRYWALRVLESIRGSVGPAEYVLLEDLRRGLGVGPLADENTPVPEVEWVGPESPIQSAELDDMPLQDALAWMHHVPTGGQRFHGPSAEGLARELPSVVAHRIEEFGPILEGVVSTVPYISVIQAMVQGVSSAIEEGQEVMSADQVASFLRAVLRRADSTTLEGDPRYGMSGSWLVGSIADLLGDRAEFMARARPDSLVGLLNRCLADADPPPELDHDPESETWDPLTAGLNSVRGKALRAVLALLATTWTREDSSSSLREAMERLMMNVAASEMSPSVRSWFGSYLPWLCKNWPVEEPGPVESLLPQPVDADTLTSWEAVFGAYVAFRPAFVDTAEILRAEYERAVDVLAQTRFLRRNADRLLSHLLALATSERTGDEWLPLCLRALAESPDEAAGQAVSVLAHAIGRGEVVRSSELGAIIRARLSEISASDLRQREITALSVLAMTLGPDEGQPSTVILDLLRRGARPEVDDLLSYLEREGVSGSAIGATLLRTAAELGLFMEPWTGSQEIIGQVIDHYASSYPSDVMAACDALGSQGRFFVEPQARDVSRRARSRIVNDEAPRGET